MPAQNAPPTSARRDSTTAALLVVAVGFLMQAGSAVAVLVIDSVGVVEALWLRTALAALILAAARPRLVRLPAKGGRLPLVALTLSLLAMNFSFYEAISRAPIGIVVAVEFLGPLGVAVAGSRRLLDGLWVLLAAAGIALLVQPGGTVSVGGLLFALLAAVFWAAFILSAKKAVGRVGSLQATVLMLVGSALIITPIFLATGVKVATARRFYSAWPSPSCRRPCRTHSNSPPSSGCGPPPMESC
jgi:inner membrane transporter RhtA